MKLVVDQYFRHADEWVRKRDFEAALKENKQSWSNFDQMAPSNRKRYLAWIADAKKPETRKKRIAEAVVLVSRNVKSLLK